MAGIWENIQGLPPGWEAKYDARTGRYYFLDHATKQSTWEDPRLRNIPPPPPYPCSDILRSMGDEFSHPSLSQTVSSPFAPVRIYPGNQTFAPGGPQRAFSPFSPLQDLTNMSTCQSTQSFLQGARLPLQDGKEEIEFALAKLSTMFPTVPENHIKDLMKKYHNREAVVISALQVQKFPLATPGPYTTFTPPPTRHFIPTATALIALQGVKSSATSPIPPQPITVLPTSSYKSPYREHIASKPQTSTIQSISSYSTTTTHAPKSLSKDISLPESLQERQSSSLYERTKGTHLLEERTSLARGSYGGGRSSVEYSVGSPGLGRSSLERSFGGSPKPGHESPLFWSRTSSPRTTRSVSEVTRSFMDSPRDWRSSPRPSPHSPKIKLRYLKGLFPKVDPTEILDVLTSHCYNVKDACEELQTRGYKKKESSLAPPKLKEERIPIETVKEDAEFTPKLSPSVIRPKSLTEDYKKKVRGELGKDFPALTPTVINMALKTAYFDENRTRQILNNMDENDRKAEEVLSKLTPKPTRRQETPPVVNLERVSPPTVRKEGRTVRPTLPRARINLAWTETTTSTSRSISEETDEKKFRSGNTRPPKGMNPSLHSGPACEVLIKDYMPWHGPNPENLIPRDCVKSKATALTDRSNQGTTRKSLAKGSDPSRSKGPAGFSRGSQFFINLEKENYSSKRL